MTDYSKLIADKRKVEYVTRREFIVAMKTAGKTYEEIDRQVAISQMMGSAALIGDRLVSIREPK